MAPSFWHRDLFLLISALHGAPSEGFRHKWQLRLECSNHLRETDRPSRCTLASDLIRLQSTIKNDESLEVSANVTATIAILNSTAASPERAQPEYWPILRQSLWLPENASYGDPLDFAVATGKDDYSFAFMSVWNTTKNETFESEAVGVNLYRGYCNAT